MSTVPVQQPEDRPRKSLAPVWHTALLLVLLYGVIALFRVISFRGVPRLLFFCIEVSADLLLIFFALFGVHLNGNELRDVLGLRPKNWEEIGASVLWGLAVGCASIIIALCLHTVFGPFYTGSGPPSHAPQSLAGLFLFFGACISAGFLEEFIFRGYLLKQIYSLNGNMTLALLLQAALFAVGHGLHQTPVGVFDKIIFSLLLGWMTIWRKSLPPAIIAHASSNALIGLIAFAIK